MSHDIIFVIAGLISIHNVLVLKLMKTPAKFLDQTQDFQILLGNYIIISIIAIIIIIIIMLGRSLRLTEFMVGHFFISKDSFASYISKIVLNILSFLVERVTASKRFLYFSPSSLLV